MIAGTDCPQHAQGEHDVQCPDFLAPILPFVLREPSKPRTRAVRFTCRGELLTDEHEHVKLADRIEDALVAAGLRIVGEIEVSQT